MVYPLDLHIRAPLRVLLKKLNTRHAACSSAHDLRCLRIAWVESETRAICKFANFYVSLIGFQRQYFSIDGETPWQQ
jgi:hypothetical protein